MAFLHQIGKRKLKTVCIQLRRCYIRLPHDSSLNSTPKPYPSEIPRPCSVFHGRPSSVYNSVRFFAAPIQFQPKPKKEEDNGPRLNDEIRAQFIRLVSDDGHTVVSRFQALERARNLKLDLVEVDKNAKPPVCKIMDFHKEAYKKQEKDKERAKSKSEVTLRKGECKEVRISEKTVSFLALKSYLINILASIFISSQNCE